MILSLEMMVRMNLHFWTITLSYLPVEVSGPGAHLEPGWHLANSYVQGFHPTVGIYTGEQGADLRIEQLIRRCRECV